jgi:Na+/H+ antiporter NhaD/arsenite permease-like protein
MEIGALIVFLLVYLGMILGNLPGLALDRTGIALLGSIAFVEIQKIPLSQIARYVDFSAIAILFSFMILSAQFYFSGFYTFIVKKIESWTLTPSKLLGIVIFISGILSAILLNDIVCLALTPSIIRICFHKKLNPVPFLLSLGCASNIGSALTLVGNPQNLLIGQVLSIPFAYYLQYSWFPCLVGLGLTWLVIHLQTKNNWYQEHPQAHFETIPFNLWQSLKGLILIIVLLFLFLFFDLPRERMALIAAGILLLSRWMASQTLLSFVDWQLLVLFIGLFIVNKGFLDTKIVAELFIFLKLHHLNLQAPLALFLISIFLSNITSNVPAVMLLLPFMKTYFDGTLVALSSTLAGNLFLIGSLANIIVISQAGRYGVKINWKQHLKVGFPLSVATLLITFLWLYFMM